MDRKKKNNTVFYLSDSQIKALSEKDFAIKTFDIARDIFLIGYYTCQRISDLGGISNENFVIKNGHKFINVRQKKTDKLISILVTDDLDKIFKKYENNFPPMLTQPALSKCIKKACKEVGINNYSLVRTHTARRSYITNKYLSFSTQHDL